MSPPTTAFDPSNPDQAGDYYASLPDPGPPAIEPSRVMILDEQEQWTMVATLSCEFVSSAAGDRLALRIEGGDIYQNPTDEYVRKTLAVRRLEAEASRLKRDLADIEKDIVEEWAQQGLSGEKHEATGATLYLDPKAWVRYRDAETGRLTTEEKTALKAQAGQIMVDLGGDLADLVRPDYNSGTLSAYFRDIYKQRLADEREKPEHERGTVDPDTVIPEPLRAILRLDATPHIVVRA